MSSGKPIVVKAKPLDVLAELHNDARRRRKVREAQPRDYYGMPDWEREARRRFGPERARWRFRCHHCGTVYDAAAALVRGMPVDQVGFACIGTVEASVACNYDGTKPYPINPVTVRLPGGLTARMLMFAEER